MKLRDSIVALFSLIAVMSTPAVAQPRSLDTGSLIVSVDSGEAFRCQLVQTEEGMVDILDRSGWDEGYPIIDWDKNSAIIVAPEIYYETAKIKFRGLYKKDDGVELLYGWEERRDSETRTFPDGSSVTTLDSRVPSGPEVLIVAFPSNLLDENMYCSRQEF